MEIYRRIFRIYKAIKIENMLMNKERYGEESSENKEKRYNSF